MYLNYYGLSKEPFHITPDPEFLFLSPSHKEALGAILYGVEKRKGFISITGEIGMGKTTVVRAFIDECDRSRNRLVYIFNTGVDFVSLLRMLIEELAPEATIEPGADESRLLDQLQRILIEEYSAGRTVVLVIDDAQAMPVRTLEQLRLLSNLETSKDKLLQLVLVGQPELEEKLESAELRQLRQRIAVRAVIRPLTPRESREYIQHRLALAGGKGAAIFSPGALKSIVKFAKGAPRILNIICDNALIAGFAEQQSSITRKLIRNVIRDYGARSAAPAVWLRRPVTALAGLAVVILAVAFMSSHISLSSQTPRLANKSEDSDWSQPLLPAEGAAEVSLASPILPAGQSAGSQAAVGRQEAEGQANAVIRARSVDLSAAAVTALAEPSANAALATDAASSAEPVNPKDAAAQVAIVPPRQDEALASKRVRANSVPLPPAAVATATESAPTALATAGITAVPAAVVLNHTQAADSATRASEEDGPAASSQDGSSPQDGNPVAVAGVPSVDRLEKPLAGSGAGHTFIVEVLPGDCVSMILKAHYQSVSRGLVERVRQLNPSLQNFDYIYPGERLILPLDADASNGAVDGRTRIVQAD